MLHHSSFKSHQRRSDDRSWAEAWQLAFPNDETPDGGGAAGGFVDVHDCAAKPDVAGGHVELRWLEGDGGFQNAVVTATEDAVVRAGHADVALKGGPAGKN